MTANISSIHNRQSERRAFSIEGESQELVDVLQKIVQNAGALLKVDNCSVALLDATGSTLVTLASLQKQGRKPRHTRFQRNEGAAGWVAENRVPLSISDVSLDPRFKRLGRTHIGSMVCVPLMEKDNFIGTLTANSPEINAFSPHALQMLTIFAEQAVLAITNVRQAELARRQANQLEMLLDPSHGIAIRDAMRMKANFLSMITHELRSPLNAINGYLDLALTGIAGELNEQQREFVQRARAGSQHLYALVEDLLLVSRADAGQLRLNPEIVRLKEIVANAIEELELLALDNGISTSIDIPNDFPAIYADPVRLQQVLRNLISNALRFTPSGGGVNVSARVIRKAGNNSMPASANSNGHAVSLVPPVTDTPMPSIGSDMPRGVFGEEGGLVAARNGNMVPSEDAEESFVLVQVRDTGRGIAPEYHQRIFERFYQIPLATAGRSSGQGLGLAIVKMIVELHGGYVMVESTPDEGSTFSFTLPGLLS